MNWRFSVAPGKFVMHACILASAALALGAPPPPPPTMPTVEFGFSYAFGDDMVLQQAPEKAAVYGFVSDGGSGVKITVSSGGKVRASSPPLRLPRFQRLSPAWFGTCGDLCVFSNLQSTGPVHCRCNGRTYGNTAALRRCIWGPPLLLDGLPTL